MPLPSTNEHRAPHAAWRNGGASQAERLPPELRPDHLQLDARTLTELLAYVARFSETVQFYSEPGAPAAGTWNLANHQGLLLLAVIAARPNSQLATEAAERLREGTAAPAHHTRQQVLRLLHEQAATLHSWHTAPAGGARLPSLPAALAEAVAELAPSLRQAAHYERLLAEQGALPHPRLLGVLVFGEGRRLFLEGLSEAALAAEYLAYAEEYRREALTVEAISESLIGLFWQAHAALAALAEVAQQALQHELRKRHDHSPEVALLVAFLRLFAHAQTTLNNIPRRHLDYYYQQVLRATTRDPQPDHTYFSFELTPNVQQHKVPAGTLVEAGKDANGRRVFFATKADATLTNWKVAALATVFVDRQPDDDGSARGPVAGIYAAAPAPPPTGTATPPDVRPLFGSAEIHHHTPGFRNKPARVGFAVAAQVLCMAEGWRQIELTLHSTPASFAQWQQALGATAAQARLSVEAVVLAAFRAKVTGPAGWLPLQATAVVIDAATYAITWTLRLKRSQPAAVAYAPALHGDNLPTTQPVLRLLLNARAPAYGYSGFAALQPTGMELRVAVKHLQQVQLSNQAGNLSPAGPFFPFGASAVPGDYLLVSAPELLAKPLTQVQLALSWQGLPPEGFARHYAGYGPGFTNDAFQASVSYLADHEWHPAPTLRQPQPLFQTNDQGTPQALRLLSVPGPDTPGATPYINTGQLRVELTGPLAGFGAALYPQVVINTVYANAPFFSSKPPETGQPSALPLPPYMPQLSRLTVSYQAEESLDPRLGLDAHGTASFFQVGPLGAFVPPPATTLQLLPDFPVEGELLVGLSPEATGQSIDLVFDLSVPSFATGAAPPTIQWAYLHNDEWRPIRQVAPRDDFRAGFANSCSVAVVLPALANVRQTLMPAGLWWLRATVAHGAAALGWLRAVHAQLVPAVRTANGPTPAAPYHQRLPAQAPTRLLSPRAAVAAVAHPRPSFGGEAPETRDAYYTRVSERLRHRGRALTPWDYERLVLEAFPEVHSALCLTADQVPGPRVPGRVTLVLLPQATADPGNAQPLFGSGLLSAVQKYLQALAPPVVRLHVLNPCYEQVQVRGTVAFQPSAALPLASCEPQLQQDLAAFLSPWGQADPQRGGFHHFLSVLDVELFIRQLPYVDDLTGFSVLKTAVIGGRHRFYDSATDQTQPLQAMGPAVAGAVQVPAAQHHLQFRPGPLRPKPARPTGVGQLRVGADFIIADSF